MFRRVLVANRGEIAVRVLATLRRLNIEGIAVHSDADAGAPFARLAARSVRLGPAPAARSYLDAAKILAVAKRTGAEAIHPGYGFLSENPDFAQSVMDAGLVWIGPSPAAMRSLGDKVAARTLAAKAGVPTAPGSPGPLRDAEDAARVADAVGYPVLLKASGGGGGIGMKVVRQRTEMTAQFAAAKSVAASAFGNDAIFLEKFIERPRHIELQFIADTHGNAFHLGERECSIQRRHQKLVEEAPSPALNDEQRSKLGDLGVRLMKSAGYTNAGTLEFLYQDGNFFFNEVNARLQVEHPVTEAIYGVDLVEAQLRVAAGEPLPWKQSDLKPRGHAIELRINAEDPLKQFLPTPGRLTTWRPAFDPHLRIDSGVEEGWRVPTQYDSLLAKFIGWGSTRAEAIAVLRRALAATRVGGTATNVAFHRELLEDTAFAAGDLTTHFLEERPVLANLTDAHAKGRRTASLLAAALASGIRGGVGNLHDRATRPRRLEVTP